MAYVTGTASDITQLRSALLTALSSNGWSVSGNIVSKGDCYVSVTDDAVNDRLALQCGLGASGTTITTPTPYPVYHMKPLSGEAFVYPMAYYIHIVGNEVYLVTNWDIDKWLTLGFGQSPIPGMPGTGVWIAGTGYAASYAGGYFTWNSGCMAGNFYASANVDARTGLFVTYSGDGGSYSAGCYVHHGLTGWSGGAGALAKTVNACRQLTLIDNPGTNATGQAILCPIQPYIERGSGKTSLVADLQAARYVRMDTLEPGDTITLGTDQWKVYPLYKKNSAVRDGGDFHSGTYGYAIRYTV